MLLPLLTAGLAVLVLLLWMPTPRPAAARGAAWPASSGGPAASTDGEGRLVGGPAGDERPVDEERGHQGRRTSGPGGVASGGGTALRGRFTAPRGRFTALLTSSGRLSLPGRGGTGRQARATELQVLDGLAATLEAGLPVARGVRLAVADVEQGLKPSTAAAWGALGRAAAEGQQLGSAWERLARHTRSPTLVAVSRAWRVADLTGAPLADALRVSAHAARERHRLGRAVEVAVAGPRATVTVLTLLPLAGVGLAAVLGVGPGRLYGDPVALTAVGSGAVLLLLGQVWVRRMVARVLRGTT